MSSRMIALLAAAGVGLALIVVVILFATAGMNAIRGDSQQQSIDKIGTFVQQTVLQAEQHNSRRDYAQSLDLLNQSVQEVRQRARQANLTHPQLDELLSPLENLLRTTYDAQRVHNTRLSDGWTVFEGNFISPDARNAILAERERAESARRAQQNAAENARLEQERQHLAREAARRQFMEDAFAPARIAREEQMLLSVYGRQVARYRVNAVAELETLSEKMRHEMNSLTEAALYQQKVRTIDPAVPSYMREQMLRDFRREAVVESREAIPRSRELLDAVRNADNLIKTIQTASDDAVVQMIAGQRQPQTPIKTIRAIAKGPAAADVLPASATIDQVVPGQSFEAWRNAHLDNLHALVQQAQQTIDQHAMELENPSQLADNASASGQTSAEYEKSICEVLERTLITKLDSDWYTRWKIYEQADSSVLEGMYQEREAAISTLLTSYSTQPRISFTGGTSQNAATLHHCSHCAGHGIAITPSRPHDPNASFTLCATCQGVGIKAIWPKPAPAPVSEPVIEEESTADHTTPRSRSHSMAR